jgi:hypothetical protein
VKQYEYMVLPVFIDESSLNGLQEYEDTLNFYGGHGWVFVRSLPEYRGSVMMRETYGSHSVNAKPTDYFYKDVHSPRMYLHDDHVNRILQANNTDKEPASV